MKRMLVAASLGFLLQYVAPALGQGADFYKGKQVDLYIGYSVGGGYDIYARLLARHMGKYLPGRPTVVPQNMPGAGSLRLANWLYQAAPRDGTAFATIGRGIAFDPLLGGQGAQFKATDFGWVGSANDEVSVCVAWAKSGISGRHSAARSWMSSAAARSASSSRASSQARQARSSSSSLERWKFGPPSWPQVATKPTIASTGSGQNHCDTNAGGCSLRRP